MKPVRGEEKNPVTRALVVRRFADEKWRTEADIATALVGDIPDEIAARIVLGSPKIQAMPLADRLMEGRRRLVKKTMWAACMAGIFEMRTGVAGTEYRYRGGKSSAGAVKRTARQSGTRRVDQMDTLPSEAFTRPDDTMSGINRVMVYQLIRDNPRITVEEITEKLRPCFRPEVSDQRVADLTRYTRKNGKGGPELVARVNARREADPVGFYEEACLATVRNIVHDLSAKSRKYVVAARLTVLMVNPAMVAGGATEPAVAEDPAPAPPARPMTIPITRVKEKRCTRSSSSSPTASAEVSSGSASPGSRGEGSARRPSG